MVLPLVRVSDGSTASRNVPLILAPSSVLMQEVGVPSNGGGAILIADSETTNIHTTTRDEEFPFVHEEGFTR